MLNRQKARSTVTSLRTPDTIALTDQSSPRSDARALLDQVIRTRAYELYLARGDAPGDALQDWICAEREYLGADIMHEPIAIAPSRRGHINGGAR